METIVKCKKDLYHNDGTKSFTKGETYKGRICNVLENLNVTNNQGEIHQLGCWAKHFINISKY